MTTRDPHTIGAGSLNAMAPPGYGEHRFDQLYLDVDPSGFQTPAGMLSQSTTPIGPLSRVASLEDLAATDQDNSSDVIANTLRNRLNNINTTEDSRAIREQAQATTSSRMCLGNEAQQQEQGAIEGRRRSSGQSLSPRNSEQEEALPSGAQTPIQPSMSHVEYSADDLARVPSYTTALQSRPNVPIDSALPNYQTAIRTPRSSPPTPQPPN